MGRQQPEPRWAWLGLRWEQERGYFLGLVNLKPEGIVVIYQLIFA